MPQGIYAQNHGIYHFEIHSNSSCFWKASPCNPLTMPSWPSCLGSKQSNPLSQTNIEHEIRKTYRNGKCYLVSCLFVELSDGGLRTLLSTGFQESTPFKTPEMISVGSRFLEARSTLSILQSFGPVSNIQVKILPILTYKNITLQQEHIIGSFETNLAGPRYGILSAFFNYLWKPKNSPISTEPTCMECQLTPKTALGCCNLGRWYDYSKHSLAWQTQRR